MAQEAILSRRRALLNEFVRGAICPSLPALAGALLVVGLMVLGCVALFTPQLLGGAGYGYFVTGPDDEYAHLTSDVLRIAQVGSGDPAVAVIGSSATREALSDAEELSDLLQKRVGRRVPVYGLATGGLNHWEAVGVVDCLGGRFRGVIVVEMSPRNLAHDRQFLRGFAESPRLALDSPAFDEEVRLAGLPGRRRLGNYFLDHYRFFVARPGALLNVIGGPVKPPQHMAEHWRTPTEAEWQRAVRGLGSWQQTYRANRDSNLAVYARLIQRLRERGGAEVALIQPPWNPRAESLLLSAPEYKQLIEEYRADVARFARDHGVPYWDLREAAQLAHGDFVDHCHVRSREARLRFTEALAKRLAAFMIEKNLATEAETCARADG